jgi:protein-disulfide isomerase
MRRWCVSCTKSRRPEDGMLPDRLRPYLDLISTLMIVATCAVLIAANWSRLWPPSDSLPTAPVSLAGAAVKGSSTAPVALIVFTDYQCPYCRRFEHEIQPDLVRDYVLSGKALLAIRHLPLTKIHPLAADAASAAVCAAAVGKFWPLHAELFKHQKELTAERLDELAASVGIEMASFRECLSDAGSAQVTQDLVMARELGLSGTPAVLVGRVRGDGAVVVTSRVRGSRPASEFGEAIEQALRPEFRPATWMAGSAGFVAVLVAIVVVRRARAARVVPNAANANDFGGHGFR